LTISGGRLNPKPNKAACSSLRSIVPELSRSKRRKIPCQSCCENTSEASIRAQSEYTSVDGNRGQSEYTSVEGNRGQGVFESRRSTGVMTGVEIVGKTSMIRKGKYSQLISTWIEDDIP
jgi:hypothetical protein